MRVLALDIGEKRIGVAVSDPLGRVATPLTVIDATDRPGEAVRVVAEEYDVCRIVVGLPLSLDGTEGAQAARVREVAEAIAGHMDVPFEYVDERLSTREALRGVRSSGTRRRSSAKKGRVDMAAAAVFLQTYLDSRSTAGGECSHD